MDSQLTKSRLFLSIYNEIDRYMRLALNVDHRVPHTHLIDELTEESRIFKRYSYDLKAFAMLRNAIVHNPHSRIAHPIAEPHDTILRLYEDIKNQVLNPPVALEAAVPAKSIFTAAPNDRALAVMRKMRERSFSHVPVVQDQKLIGVFSENTVFSYLVNNHAVDVGRETLIKEFLEYISIGSHENEYFSFVPKGTLVLDVESMFQKGLKNKKRLAVVFITENGKKEEQILGLITAWDLVKYDDNLHEE